MINGIIKELRKIILEYFDRVYIIILIYEIVILLKEDCIDYLVGFCTLVGCDNSDSFLIVFDINMITMS